MSTITFHYHNFISKCKDFEGALAIVLDYTICALSGGVDSPWYVYYSSVHNCLSIIAFVVALLLIAQSLYLLIYFYPSYNFFFRHQNTDFKI